MLFRFLFFTLFAIIISAAFAEVKFNLARDDAHYTGYYLRGQASVHLVPKLQALVARDGASKSGQICGFNLLLDESQEAKSFPFEAVITDPEHGYGELRLKNGNSLDQYLDQKGKTINFFLEAFDCDLNPEVSNRVKITVNVREATSGPVFPLTSYQFPITVLSPVGSFVGQVSASSVVIDSGQENLGSICQYSLVDHKLQQPPFTIDSNGVIRTNSQFNPEAATNIFYFKVRADDCQIPMRSSLVDVQVTVIEAPCHLGWTNLPNRIELEQESVEPELIFGKDSRLDQFLRLTTCRKTACQKPRINLELALMMPREYSDSSRPEYANFAQCEQDPDALAMQRKICNLNPNTDLNLLPQTESDLVYTPGRPQMDWIMNTVVFDSSLNTVWPVELDKLLGFQRQSQYEGAKANLFLDGFSVTFWLKRGQFKLDTQTVLVSRDQANNEEMFSVLLTGRDVVVRMRLVLGENTEQNQLVSWTFGMLPVDKYDHEWHHYALTMDPRVSAQESLGVQLLVDGELLASQLASLPRFKIESVSHVEPSSEITLTVGADWNTHAGKVFNGLDGQLAGMTLLLGGQEADNTLSCLAKCGEGLLLPNARELLAPGVTLDMQPELITVKGGDMNDLVRLLAGVAYARADPLERRSLLDKHVALARNLQLRTNIHCFDGQVTYIPDATIDLVVGPLRYLDTLLNRDLFSQSDSTSSMWVPKQSTGSEGPEAKLPVLEFQGTEEILRDYSEQGIALFQNLTLLVSGDDLKLDNVMFEECLINPLMIGGLEPDYNERLVWPKTELRDKGINTISDNFGVRLRGRDTAMAYLDILRLFVYHPRSVEVARLESSFNLICSANQGRLVTNVFQKRIVLLNKNVSKDAKASAPLQNALSAASGLHKFDDVDDLQDYLASEFEASRKEASSGTPASHRDNTHWMLLTSILSVFVVVSIGVAYLYRDRLQSRKSGLMSRFAAKKRNLHKPSKNATNRIFGAFTSRLGGMELIENPNLRTEMAPDVDMDELFSRQNTELTSLAPRILSNKTLATVQLYMDMDNMFMPGTPAVDGEQDEEASKSANMFPFLAPPVMDESARRQFEEQRVFCAHTSSEEVTQASDEEYSQELEDDMLIDRDDDEEVFALNSSESARFKSSLGAPQPSQKRTNDDLV